MTDVSFISFQIKAGTLRSPTKLSWGVEWISSLLRIGREATCLVIDYTDITGKKDVLQIRGKKLFTNSVSQSA